MSLVKGIECQGTWYNNKKKIEVWGVITFMYSIYCSETNNMGERADTYLMIIKSKWVFTTQKRRGS